MKCATCYRDIKGGEQARRQAEYWEQPDGTVRVYGHGMPDGPRPKTGAGQLVKVKHSGCYHADRKREQRAGR